MCPMPLTAIRNRCDSRGARHPSVDEARHGKLSDGGSEKTGKSGAAITLHAEEDKQSLKMVQTIVPLRSILSHARL